jgi:hypothetical protein
MTPEEYNDASRGLQDVLFNHRQNSPLIFDFVYRLFKSQAETEMNQTAETMIQDISHLLPKGKTYNLIDTEPIQTDLRKKVEKGIH